MASSRVFNASRALMAAVKGGATTTTIRVSKPTGPIVIDTAAAPKAPTGIMKPCPISPALRKFLGGAPEASRTHAIKHIWVHIKDQKLQIIVPIYIVVVVMDGKRDLGHLVIVSFEGIKPLADVVMAIAEEDKELKSVEYVQLVLGVVIWLLFVLKEMTRKELTVCVDGKQIIDIDMYPLNQTGVILLLELDYFIVLVLRNPANKREIICDEKLKTIFAGKDKVGMMEISKLIGPHFIK
ncbi:hypothetical protein GIB67_012490 [Kingdonia uniflora]|uniref:SWIB domain-containing protein n=1 Tax=Kingdonia uniflora TaxID=39325 RepID=A0A7J7MVK5_9MAGN|nr:hypothetical protein GIB67_012490 [Kingdonia uniflora]